MAEKRIFLHDLIGQPIASQPNVENNRLYGQTELA